VYVIVWRGVYRHELIVDDQAESATAPRGISEYRSIGAFQTVCAGMRQNDGSARPSGVPLTPVQAQETADPSPTTGVGTPIPSFGCTSRP